MPSSPGRQRHNSRPRRESNRKRLGPRVYQKVMDRDPVCVYCDGPGSQLDHFIPRVLGGSDDVTNLVRACASCNCSKKDKTPGEWFRAVGLSRQRLSVIKGKLKCQSE